MQPPAGHEAGGQGGQRRGPGAGQTKQKQRSAGHRRHQHQGRRRCHRVVPRMGATAADRPRGGCQRQRQQQPLKHGRWRPHGGRTCECGIGLRQGVVAGDLAMHRHHFIGQQGAAADDHCAPLHGAAQRRRVLPAQGDGGQFGEGMHGRAGRLRCKRRMQGAAAIHGPRRDRLAVVGDQAQGQRQAGQAHGARQVPQRHPAQDVVVVQWRGHDADRRDRTHRPDGPGRHQQARPGLGRRGIGRGLGCGVG